MLNELDALLQDGLLWFAAERVFVEEQKLRVKQLFSPALNAVDPTSRTARFGITEIDRLLPGGALKSGDIHEFSYLEKNTKRYPPCSILSALAAGAALQGKRTVLWIGRAIWPTPHILEQAAPGSDFRSRNIFIDAPNKKLLLWALEASLRSGAAALVIADLNTLNMALSRRLTLAAKQGNTIGFILRDYRKGSVLSAAATRWRIAPAPSLSSYPCFKLELLKVRGVKPQTDTWLIEVCDGEDQKVSMRLAAGNSAADLGKDRALGPALYAAGGGRL